MSSKDIARESLGWFASSRDAFLRTLRTRPTRRAWVLFAAAVIVGLVLLASHAPRGFNFGDGPIYADRIADRAFDEVTKHLGYFYLGVAATSILPTQPDYALNLLNALLGALSAGLVASIAFTLTGRESASAAATLTFLATLLFVQEAVLAEVYMPQLCFWLLCVQLTLWNQPIGAGIAFASAFVITPSTILSAPFILLLRPQRRFVFLWAVSAALPAAVILAPHARSFLWGDSGVLAMPPGNLTRIQAIAKEGKELARFSWLLVFSIAGLVVVARSKRHRIFLLALAALWLFPFLVGERYSDVPVQLPLYAMLTVLAGVGVARLVNPWPQDRVVPAVAVVLLCVAAMLVGFDTYRSTAQGTREIDAYRSAVLEMTQALEPGDLVLATYPVLRLSRHYARSAPQAKWISLDALSDTTTEGRENADALTDALTSGRRIWLPDPRAPDARLGDLFGTAGYEVKPYEAFWVATRTASS